MNQLGPWLGPIRPSYHTVEAYGYWAHGCKGKGTQLQWPQNVHKRTGKRMRSRSQGLSPLVDLFHMVLSDVHVAAVGWTVTLSTVDGTVVGAGGRLTDMDLIWIDEFLVAAKRTTEDKLVDAISNSDPQQAIPTNHNLIRSPQLT